MSTPYPQSGVSRRDMMKGLAFAALAGGLSSSADARVASNPASGYPKISGSTGDTIRVSDTEPVVEIAFGKIRGYAHNEVYAFKAIPYGNETSGTNRFMPPAKPAPWTGVRSCLYHGFVCPQPQRAGWKNNEES